jgi:hypothetical protein
MQRPRITSSCSGSSGFSSRTGRGAVCTTLYATLVNVSPGKGWACPSPLGLAQLVVTRIHRNPVDPGAECRVSLELTGLAENCKERFLGGVQGAVPVADDPEAYREHTVLVAKHDCVESTMVARNHAPDQFDVGRWCRHGSNRNSDSCAK